jgi:hypothetical protein
MDTTLFSTDTTAVNAPPVDKKTQDQWEANWEQVLSAPVKDSEPPTAPEPKAESPAATEPGKPEPPAATAKEEPKAPAEEPESAAKKGKRLTESAGRKGAEGRTCPVRIV